MDFKIFLRWVLISGYQCGGKDGREVSSGVRWEVEKETTKTLSGLG